MPYHPRFETNEAASFITTRCRNSELWFAGNTPGLEEALLGYTAKFSERYEVVLYGVAISGNHIHCLATFQNLNRAAFMRDLNSCQARAVSRFVPSYPGGGLWGRRYSAEIVPFQDVEKQFFYTVLQPVQDGMVPRLAEYPFYNCFQDAINGRARQFKVIRWSEYYEAKRCGRDVTPQDFADTVTLRFARLPGYEHLSQKEYKDLMLKKLEHYRQEVLRQRLAEGKTEFMGRERLLAMVPGSLPVKTKKSTRESKRPRVLSGCIERWQFWITWYFDRYFAYKEASFRFRSGAREVEFPPGTYRPVSVVGPPA